MKTKQLAAWLLTAVLLLSLVGITGAQAAPSDTVYVRKHVSLVYDNSGSMSMELDGTENLKWSYASYSAQIFAGLLNESDTLTMTFMNRTNSISSLEVDLTADRQKQVDNILKVTNYAKDGTPFTSVTDAEKVLVKKGLLSDSQIGDNQINKSEQYWLVLTTDGNFDNMTAEQVEASLENLLKTYSNLHMVYFGIGTEGDQSDTAAIDFRNSKKLNAYPNFTAVYAEEQTQIVSTMQQLANRISGRYSVSNGIKFNGNEVTLRISGETSPIRNVALLAQNTDAKLLKAEDEDGKALTIARCANVKYPQNSNYDCMSPDTKGGHTALITCPDGKFPPGTVKLTFSEPVNEKDFSLMYEPAVYVQLTVMTKDASGDWVEVPYGDKVSSGKPIKVGYMICEDGTNTPIDAAKLPGVTTEHITCGDQTIGRDSAFTAPSGTASITATVSMMDGAYTVSTVRTLQVIALEDYTFEISDPLSFYPNELSANSAQYIDFKVFYQGQPATADIMTDFTINSEQLQGKMTTPGGNTFRFTPQQADCEPGTYKVELCFAGQSVASQTVTVKELVTSYSAKAGDDLVLFSNQVAANTQPIVFTVTCTRGNDNFPIAKEDAQLFRIQAVAADGTVLKGQTAYADGGQLQFITDDPNGQPGDYTVTLYQEDQAMASANLSILKYNATYTAQVFLTGDATVDLLGLRENQNGLAFVIYADDQVCTGVQLQSMLGQELLLQHQPDSKYMRMDISVDTFEGKPALILRPTSTAGHSFGAAWQKLWIAFDLFFGFLKDGPLTAQLTVVAEKGTQVTGQLEMVYDPSGIVPWLVGALIALVVMALIGGVILCNFAMPRIHSGIFTYYCVNLYDNGQAEVVANEPMEHRRKFYLRLFWIPEQVEFMGQVFVAEQRGFFRSKPPICKLENDGSTIFTYCYQDSGFIADQAIRILEAAGMRKFNFHTLRQALPTMPIVTPNDVNTSQSHVSQYMDFGSYIVRKSETTVELWVFSRDELSQEEEEEQKED